MCAFGDTTKPAASARRTGGGPMTFEEILEHLRQAQGDPHLLALATTDSVLASHPPALRQALEAAAIPHWFDEQILGQMMNVEPAAASAGLATLKTLPFVEPFQAKGGWNVHEASSCRAASRG